MQRGSRAAACDFVPHLHSPTRRVSSEDFRATWGAAERAAARRSWLHASQAICITPLRRLMLGVSRHAGRSPACGAGRTRWRRTAASWRAAPRRRRPSTLARCRCRCWSWPTRPTSGVRCPPLYPNTSATACISNHQVPLSINAYMGQWHATRAEDCSRAKSDLLVQHGASIVQ